MVLELKATNNKMDNRTKNAFGIDFWDIDLESITHQIIHNKLTNKILATPNVDHVVRYNRDKEFKEEYDNIDVFINDSRILKLLSKFFMNKLSNVVPGSDLTKNLFDRLSYSQHSAICIIGAEKYDIDKIKDTYKLIHINHYAPSFGFITNEHEILDIIKYCQSLPESIYFLAVGSPQQEVLANRLKQSNIKGTFLCVGASILFLSGREKRAPIVFQQLHLEWFYRLVQSPKRLWRRYLIVGPYIFKIAAVEAINNWKRRSS
jgi:N-acetylglucosaminyldiphosphoundecaprenol N-acetyl-beta-D-mannosaminyltransferase